MCFQAFKKAICCLVKVFLFTLSPTLIGFLRLVRVWLTRLEAIVATLLCVLDLVKIDSRAASSAFNPALLCHVKEFWQGNPSRSSHELYLQSGPSPAGGQWCLVPPFEIDDPPFHVWPTGCCIHPTLYFKNVAPLLVFGPSFSFLAPPAATSWRRACLQCLSKFPFLSGLSLQIKNRLSMRINKKIMFLLFGVKMRGLGSFRRSYSMFTFRRA